MKQSEHQSLSVKMYKQMQFSFFSLLIKSSTSVLLLSTSGLSRLSFSLHCKCSFLSRKSWSIFQEILNLFKDCYEEISTTGRMSLTVNRYLMCVFLLEWIKAVDLNPAVLCIFWIHEKLNLHFWGPVNMPVNKSIRKVEVLFPFIFLSVL